MKAQKIIYWIATILLCLMMSGSAFMYLTNTDQIIQVFEGLGYPAWLVIPLGIAKLLAVAAILTKKSAILKRLAYYGLAIDFVLAFMAHLTANDGDWPGPVIAMVLLIVSYVYDRKLFS